MRPFSRRSAKVACLLAVGLLGAVGHARGNGRFPEAQRLLEHPSDDNRLYLAGTYGLLVTENRGQSWHYVCEQSFALEVLEGDPLLEILPQGSILGGMKDQLTRTQDCGCSWQPVLAQSSTQNVVDLTTDAAGTALALVQDTSTFPSRLFLFEATKDGSAWQKISDLPADLPSAFTIDVAPSDPQRLYVSAYSPALKQGVLAVSKDRGGMWQELPITSSSDTSAPYIAAVHPTNPERVFLRTRVNDYTADFSAQDALLVTDDGGGSWSEVLHRQAMLLGFALSPDGSSVLAGYGDSVTAGISVNPDDLGIYRASTSDLTFEQILSATVTCLRWTARGVYACTVQDGAQVTTPGMSVGFAPDASFTLASASPLTPLLDLHQVAGPLGCSAALCSDSWTLGGDAGVAVCQQLGASCSFATGQDITCPVPTNGDAGASGAPSDAGAGAPATAGNGGSGGSGGNAGISGGNASGSTGGAGVASGSDAAPASSAKKGCGCRLPGSPERHASLELLALGALGALVRARLRRRQRPS